MIRAYIPKSLRRWLKKKIYNNISSNDKEIFSEKVQINQLTQDQTRNMNESGLIYFPHHPASLSYIIHKQKLEYETCEAGLPIPPQDLWLGYGKTNEEYLYAKFQVETMLNIVKSSGFSFRNGNRILDFGCGAGRMIRWLKPLAEMCEIWGADISAEHIYWANQYLKPPFNFVTTTTIPHLPFEDGYFDFVFAGSVFTHIDDLADAWFLELRRILSPEGLLYITINDNNSILELDNNPVYKETWIRQFMNENPIYADNKMSYGMIVNGRGPSSQVFYDVEYFKKALNATFEILSINNTAYGFQTGYLLKRK